MLSRFTALVSLAALLSACGGGGGTGGALGPPVPAPPVPTPGPGAKIAHIVIIVQENRTMDNLFNGFPGADTVQNGQNSSGQTVALPPVDIVTPYDVNHSHQTFLTEYAGGMMNGFDLVTPSSCSGACPRSTMRAYGYVPRREVQPYWDLAQQYVLADRMFQSNEGPSFPAHQYIVSGTSQVSESNALLAENNPSVPNGVPISVCDTPGTTIALIDPTSGVESTGSDACLDRPTLFDLLDQRQATWRYYQPDVSGGLWYAPSAIRHIRFGPDYANVIMPNTTVFTDIANGRLARVSWILPTAAASDHTAVNDGSGPAWVASVVNAIGTSRYWKDTAIFVTWDDWGGWYDHVKPPTFNAYENGFRVPLLVISPYARASYVSHVQHEFGSIIKFTEETFGTGSLGYTDARADDLGDCFDFAQTPVVFRQIQASRRASYFARLKPDTRIPDPDG